MAELSPFRLDPANQCLWRRTGSGGEERILLTPTEFGVLDHLVEHAGQLVTHRELLDAVWPGTAIEPQVVKNKIFHLRRVLEDEPKRPRYIETLPRRGYRFVGRLERGTVGDGDALASAGSRLVGREAALGELWQACRNAIVGKVQVVFLTGEAGIGKTALSDEFQRQVAASTLSVRFRPRPVRGRLREQGSVLPRARGRRPAVSRARRRPRGGYARHGGPDLAGTVPRTAHAAAPGDPPAGDSGRHAGADAARDLQRAGGGLGAASAAAGSRGPSLGGLFDSRPDLRARAPSHAVEDHAARHIPALGSCRVHLTAGWAQARSGGAPSGPGNRAAATH